MLDFQDDPLLSTTPTPDFVDRGNLDRENDTCLAKVVLTMKTVVLNNLTPVRMTPSKTPTLDFKDGGHLDVERKVGKVQERFNSSPDVNSPDVSYISTSSQKGHRSSIGAFKSF